MSQIPLQRQAGTFTTFRAVVVCQAIVFLFAATLHTGAFGVPQLVPAMIVEGLCGIACVVSAYALFSRKRWAQKNVLITQVLILVAVLVGISAITSSPDLRTAINLGLHGVMLALILAALVLLAIPGTRKAFRSDQAP